MKKKLIYEDSIREIMLRIGLFFDDISIDEDLQQVFTESIIFITFIIELEQAFNIQIPEQYLTPQMIGSLRQLDNLLCELMPEKKWLSVWNKVKYVLKEKLLKFTQLIKKDCPKVD